MKPILIVQVVTAIILITLVTLQSKDSSLGSSFSTITQSGFHTKRGPEKIIYLATIISAVVFVILSLLNIIFFK